MVPKKMFLSIDRFIEQHNLIPSNSKIIVGLSGGPDSIFLLHLLAHKKKHGLVQDAIAAHLDHEWRPNSDKDVQFCHDLTKEYDIRLVATKMSDLPISLKFNGSKEELGRRARRSFFEQLRKKENADSIALAHHAQDQQETFFIRLVRGASLTGLTAIKPQHGHYIRPLLEINKSDMIDFLDANNIPYLIDPTNDSDKFLRNRIRKTVIPALKSCDERFDSKFKQALKNLQETEQFLQNLTQKTFAHITQQTELGLQVNVEKFLDLQPMLQQRVLLHWLCLEQVQFPVSNGFFLEIIRFLTQPNGATHTLHQGWSIVKRKRKAFITISRIQP